MDDPGLNPHTVLERFDNNSTESKLFTLGRLKVTQGEGSQNVSLMIFPHLDQSLMSMYKTRFT